MQNNLQIFENSEFGKLEVLMINGKSYFPATQCAEILDYSKPHNAISRHCRASLKRGVIDSLGRTQEKLFIPEGDLYRLIIRSKLPAAEKFETWVFDEVLPEIRRRGGYIHTNEDDTEADIMVKAVLIAQKIIDAMDTKILNLEDQIETNRPLIEFAETVTESSDTVTVEELAKIAYGKDIDIGRNRLYRWLRDFKYLCNSNKPYQSYINKGYFKVAEGIDGEQKLYVQTLITGKGQVEIVKRLRQFGGVI